MFKLVMLALVATTLSGCVVYPARPAAVAYAPAPAVIYTRPVIYGPPPPPRAYYYRPY